MQADAQRWRLDWGRKQLVSKQDQREQFLSEKISLRDERVTEATKKAEEAADDLREELQFSVVKTANTVYTLIAIGFPTLLGIFVAKRAAKENGLKYEQKFGVATMVCALFLGLTALTISDGWVPQFDALQNLMGRLHIALFPEHDGQYAERMIDIPTKYVMTALAAVFSYGFMAYLGITPVWRLTPTTPHTKDATKES